MISFLIISFIFGAALMGIHHENIHKDNKWFYVTATLTCAWYLKDFHKIHHKYFLESLDEFSWARKNENFYKFFYRTHFKRRTFGRDSLFLMDLISFAVMFYLFDIYYLAIVIGFTFHWEMFEYWSHYGLKDMTDNKYWWSWNVIGKVFNKITLNVGKHSQHHVAGSGDVPVVYSKSLWEAYLPLFPKRFFQFMERQVILNKKRGILG
jgi:hypothetical protein